MHSLTLALDGGDWSASHPGHFIPGKRAPCTHWIGGWVCPRAINKGVYCKYLCAKKRGLQHVTGNK